jgi:hypothetical protein
VPLSEREQKILQEIERDLYREDPAFAREVRRPGPGWDGAARARVGALLVLAGILCLVGFFARGWLVAGVAAFGAMVAGVVLLAGSFKALLAQRQQPQQQPRERLAKLLRRVEERIRQRYRRS